MANDNSVAVIIELFDGGRPVRFTCAEAASIPKGTLLHIHDLRTAVASHADNDMFCGVCAMEKVGGDGSTCVTAYTCGIFDIEQLTAVTNVAGERVSLAGANIVSKCAASDLLFADVGISLEDASAEEHFACLIGSGL